MYAGARSRRIEGSAYTGVPDLVRFGISTTAGSLRGGDPGGRDSRACKINT